MVRTITTEWHPKSDPEAIERRMAEWCRWMEANSMPWGLTSATPGDRWAAFSAAELAELESLLMSGSYSPTDPGAPHMAGEIVKELERRKP
jgi:hypothetical protein